jgi:hypothetical protein
MSFLRTYSMFPIDPRYPNEEFICIEDVAHSLSLINRYNGHSKFPISVAQHAWWASILLDGTGHELQALHHDDSEYLLGDITKWLKQTPEFAAYREIEDRVQRQLYRHWGCAEETSPEVEHVDRLLVRFEMTKAYDENYVIAHPDYPPLTDAEKSLFVAWKPMYWETAQRRYLVRHAQLTARLRGTSAPPRAAQGASRG